jgi:hypothetical protein
VSSLAAKLAEHVREYYSWEKIEKRGMNEPVVVEDEHGFRSLSLPREQMFEPYRSFRLRDVTVLDTVLIVSFAWGPPEPDRDDHIYPFTLDTRKLQIDPWDDRLIAMLVAHHLEFTLGCQIETWEAERAIPVGEGCPLSSHGRMSPVYLEEPGTGRPSVIQALTERPEPPTPLE